MSSLKQDSRYYSVGGPVQPDRACYVTRKSDEILFSRLAQGEYCQVLAPPDTGKTSLMAHTAERLRDAGVAVATVDLAQISNRDLSEDVGRWYYSFAYRVMRELRIRSNMQSWWQDRAGLTNLQRLREFFLDVILADTTQPVVVFVDRIDAVLDRKVSLELFGAIRACHDGRATEPEYRRLTFALLGAESVGHKIPQGGNSPFSVSTHVPVADFLPDELQQLTVGIGGDVMASRAVAARVWHWTSGHPYLSQKIFRALARRDAPPDAAAVDAAAATLFLPRNSVREEPHLAMVAEQLLYDTKTQVARLNLYGKIRKGAKVTADPMLRPHRELLRSGVVSVDADGKLAPRNLIYARVFTPYWVNQSLPLSFRSLGAAAALLAVILAIPVWYTEYLPRPYVRTLSTPGVDFVSAVDAFQRLRMFPGFKLTAKELFTNYVVRESRQSTSLPEVRRLSERLPDYPGRDELRVEMRAEYWDRSVQRALQQGRRDDALLFSLQALERPTQRRQLQVGELLSDDFDRLLGTIRHQGPLADLALDADTGLLSLLDEEHGVTVWQLGDRAPQRALKRELVAEEIIPLQVSLLIEAKRQGQRLQSVVFTDHPRPQDIQVELRAPSGRAASVKLRPDQRTADGGYLLDSRRDKPLRSLLAESPAGTWTAYFTDAQAGTRGRLERWELRIDQQVASAPMIEPGPQIIPEPGPARQAVSRLDPSGQRALIWPTGQGVRGDILQWDIGSGEVIGRLPRPPNFEDARFALGNSAVLVISGRSIDIWDTQGAKPRLTVAFDPSLVPVLSPGGRFLVVDSVVDDPGTNALAVWDLETGKEVSRLVTGALAELAATDAAGQFLAVGDSDRLVRLWSVSGNSLVGEFAHGAAPASIVFSPDGQWLATQDQAYTLRLWNLESGGNPVLVRTGSAARSVSFDGDWLMLGSLDSGFETLRLTDLARRGPILQHGLPGLVRDGLAAGGRVVPTRGVAITWDGESAVKAWALPPAPELSAGGGSGVAANIATLAPGGDRIAVATGQGDVRIFPAGQALVLTPDQRPAFIGHLEPVSVLRFAPSGAVLASGALDGSLRVWDVASGAPRSFFVNQADGAVLDLGFTPDSRFLVSASRRSVLVTDAQSGEILTRVGIQSTNPHLAIGPGGEDIWIAGDRGGLTRWRWREEQVDPVIEAGADMRGVALDPLGRWVATANARRRIQLWDTQTGQQTGVVRVAAAVDRLWFNRDGRFLFAQTGPWVQRFAVLPDAISSAETRLLNATPDDGLLQEPGVLRLLFGAQTSRPDTVAISLGLPLGPLPNESQER
ncbi:MAG: AAA-like domain-containing protein, partial [Gammaproteobacteria bacterium]